MPEQDPKEVRHLISSLESKDSFERLKAIDELEQRTQRTFGFRFNAPPEAREEAVRRWNAWWKEQQRQREKKSRLEAAVQLSGGALDIGILKKAIEEIPAEKIQGYLNALILKMKAQQAPCEACRARPATVLVTELRDGRYRASHLCESCASERGDVLN